MPNFLKAPFPYFGGKALIADTVWKYLGDVKQYIEPFFGSGAVLLRRPPSRHEICYEIVNDKDALLSNVWRAIKYQPAETAKWADWPINHADLVARRKVLIASEQRLISNLTNDDVWCDPKLAGYWIWAASCWIGSGLTRPNAIPHLTRNQGVNSNLPIQVWFEALAARLRHVKVVCGDWTRVCGGHWQAENKPVGLFFDPPYGSLKRKKEIYFHDSFDISAAVEAWVLERGKNPDYRIVVCGYDDEHASLQANGWKVRAYKAQGGYGNLGNSQGKVNRHRERLFVSPHCVTLRELWP